MEQQSFFDDDTRVVKSNQLVQSRMNWTKLEHRVVAMLVAQLKKEDEKFEEQRVYIKDIADLSGRNGKSLYDQAEVICRKLLDQKIQVRTQTEDGRRRYKGYNCMSTCEYVEGSGYIEAKFNEDMKPFLLQLKRRFTQYNLKCFMRLSSQHSMRIYELLKMREGIKYLRIEVEELREILCCEHSYTRFADLKRWVLEKARDELMKKADIYFNYKVTRDGQTPVQINFLIKNNSSEAKKDDQSTLIQSEESNQEEGIEVEKDGATQVSEPKFNVFAMVLDEMSQEQLDTHSEEEIQNAIDEAREHVSTHHSSNGTANKALKTYKRALRYLEA
jgi:Protein involved in initiation of plasmid replication